MTQSREHRHARSGEPHALGLESLGSSIGAQPADALAPTALPLASLPSHHLRASISAHSAGAELSSVRDALIVGGVDPLAFVMGASGLLCINESTLIGPTLTLLTLPEAMKSAGWDERSPERTVEQPVLFLAGAGSRAPFHWLHDTLPRLLAAQRAKLDVAVLIPADAGAFITESLRMMGVSSDRIELYHPGERLRVNELWLTEDLGAHPERHAKLLEGVREKLLDAASEGSSAESAQHGGERIYISRQGCGLKRSIENAAEVEALIRERGYAQVRMETLSLAEQIRIAAGAHTLVGPHGAGLFHALFMNNGRVTELFPVDDQGRDTNAPCWYRILECHVAKQRAVSWTALSSGIKRYSSIELDQFKIVVDVARLARVLDGAPGKDAVQAWHRV